MFRRRRRDDDLPDDAAGVADDAAGVADDAAGRERGIGGSGLAGQNVDEPQDDEPQDDEPYDDVPYDDDLGAEFGDEPAGQPARAGPGAAAAEPVTGTGPWDGAARYPAGDRMDFGSLLLPARPGLDVQIGMAEDQGVWLTVVRGDSGLQLQAFAAPKTSGLWDQIRQEIADEVRRSGGQGEEAAGPFGTEFRARMRTEGQSRGQLEPVRFLGVDGPRWCLQGVMTGPAARHPEQARPLEEVFADVVVVRGDHPVPPRDALEIRLPAEAREALEQELGEQAGPAYPNPFERGPEITETR